MKKTSLYTIKLLFLLLLLYSCQGGGENAARDGKDDNARLQAFFEREFEVDLEDSPMLQTRLGIKDDYDSWDSFSHKRHAEDREKAKRRLKFLKDSIDRGELDAQAALSYRLYRQQLEQEVDDYKFRFHNYPVNQMFGIHAQVPAFLINMHQIDSIEDAKAYISRLRELPRVFEEVTEAMILREFNGIMPPQFVFDHTIEASRNVIKGKPFEKSAEASVLLKDFTEKVEGLQLSSTKRDELLQEAQEALVEKVQPAYKKLLATLEDQRQRATDEAGAWKFPKGGNFYKNALKRTTTTDLSPEEIHKIGLQEVARIHKEMEEIKEEVGFEGSLSDFFKFMRTDEQFYYENTPEGRQAYLTEAKQVIDEMRGHLDDLFETQPEAEIMVKAVEPFREKSAGKAFYQQPALDGSRPGTYYANLYDMEAMPTYQLEALAFHEGIPGHHMQIAIAQELEEVPMFRKLSFYPAYVEGWGLYAEWLSKEIGFYEDPYSDFGRLAMELWRSIRLVVDTGIHHKKWTREEAIDYYMSNSPNAQSDAVKMVERHIVMPGQATAYKIGMIKLLELRGQAAEALGEDFDLAEFHDVVLTHGAVPLNILEDMVAEWVESKGGSWE